MLGSFSSPSSSFPISLSLSLFQNLSFVSPSMKFKGTFSGSGGRLLEYQSPNHVSTFNVDERASNYIDSPYDNAPTEKQLQFAEFLSTQRGLPPLSEEVKNSSSSVSLFIEESLALTQRYDKKRV
jgi:hypothetical protein